MSLDEAGGRHRWRWVLVLAGALTVVVALAVGALGLSISSLFRVDRVVVTGTHQLSSGDVVRLAGLAGGGNVFWLDVADIRRRLESDPWIAHASVTKSLRGTVAIAVKERTPVAAVDRSGAYELVAGDGTILGTGDRPATLPVIDAGSETGSIAGPAGAVAALAKPLRAQVVTVVMDGAGELSLSLRSRVTVAYGPAVDADQKGQALGEVLAWADRRGLEVASVDVSAPSEPSIRLVGGGTP